MVHETRRVRKTTIAKVDIRPSTFELINFRALEKQVNKVNIQGGIRPITFEKPNIPKVDFGNIFSHKKR